MSTASVTRAPGNPATTHPAYDWPDSPPMVGGPLVLDTDIGGDADDAVALTIAALIEPRLALVLTCDETDGQRARFARLLLDQLGRLDVPVVAGAELDPAGRHFCVADLIPPAVPAQPTDVLAAVAAVLGSTPGTVRWMGCGPATNLAHLARGRPDWIGRLRVTQMGGAFHYRNPERGEHNSRRDVPAIHTVLATIPRLRLVLSDTTFTPEIILTPRSALYRLLARPGAPPWARLLRDHLDRWIATSGHLGSIMHDPLALSAALDLPFVTFTNGPVSVDELGRMSHNPDGAEVYHSHSADHPAFRRWLADTITGPLANPRSAEGTAAAWSSPDAATVRAYAARCSTLRRGAAD